MTNLDLAIAAWTAVRRHDDGVWNVLPMGMKAKLVDLAAKYRGGARVAEGDYPPEGFAEKVWELSSGAVAPEPAGDEEVFLAGAGKEIFGSPAVERRVGLASRRVNEAHLNLAHFPGSERRKGVLDRRIPELAPTDARGIQTVPAEHEDIHIPSPNSEDVDPLGVELAEKAGRFDIDRPTGGMKTEFERDADTPKEVTLPSTADAQPVKVIAPLGTGDVTVHGDGEPVVVKEGQSATFRKPKGSRKKGGK